MKVLFIGLTENSSLRGVERYCLELLKKLQYTENMEVTLLLGEWQEYYKNLDTSKINFLYYDGSNSKISRHLYLIKNIRSISKGFDLVHYGNTMPYIRTNDTKTIMTIHDIAEYFVPEKYSFFQLLYRKLIVKQASKKVDLILTDSVFSKKSIINKLTIDEKKVSVVYLGIEHFTHNEKNLSEVNDDYILYWSVLENSKGVLETVQAFTKVEKSINNIQLYIVGKKGNAYSEFIKLTKDNDKIKYFGYLNDQELQMKIKNAKAILFPSKYEGFGFPALEAFLLNSNVITSATTSLGEISKNFALQVNPNKIEEISNAILNIIENPYSYTQEERLTILKDFSWDKCAQETVENYIKVVGKV